MPSKQEEALLLRICKMSELGGFWMADPFFNFNQVGPNSSRENVRYCSRNRDVQCNKTVELSDTEYKSTYEGLDAVSGTTMSAAVSVRAAQLSNVSKDNPAVAVRVRNEDNIETVRDDAELREKVVTVLFVEYHNDEMVLPVNKIVSEKKFWKCERETALEKKRKSSYMHRRDDFSKDVEEFEKETPFTVNC